MRSPPRSAAGEVGRKHAGFETRDMSASGAVFALLGLFGAVALSIGAVAGLVAFFDAGDTSARHAGEARQGPPAPRLQANPAADRAAIESVARQRRDSYGWVDKARGRARIPVERAMVLLSRRGWPDHRAGGGMR